MSSMKNLKRGTFLLVHGSWHGGWAWESVAAHLSARGHSAHAPTLAGHGPDAARLGVKHQDCVMSVLNYIQRHELSEIIVVGHSFGGTVAQKVATEIPNRVARLVFLDAILLEHNECVMDILPPEYVAAFCSLAEQSSDNTMLIPWEIWRDNFMQDAPEPVARSFWQRLSPEPNQVNLDKLTLKQFYSLSIPKSFIHCRQDKALPPGSFHPQMSSRLGTFKLLEMDGGHEVMFTRPGELVNKIIEASSD